MPSHKSIEGSVLRYKCYLCAYCKYMSEDSVQCEYFEKHFKEKFVKPSIECAYYKPKLSRPAAPM